MKLFLFEGHEKFILISVDFNHMNKSDVHCHRTVLKHVSHLEYVYVRDCLHSSTILSVN